MQSVSVLEFPFGRGRRTLNFPSRAIKRKPSPIIKIGARSGSGGVWVSHASKGGGATKEIGDPAISVLGQCAFVDALLLLLLRDGGQDDVFS